MINLEAIAKIESGGDPKAFNATTKARGLYQITPVCLADWHKYHPGELHSFADLFDPAICRKIADWYFNDRIPRMLTVYGFDLTITNVLAAYNWGIGNLKKFHRDQLSMPQETINYIQKYKELTNG